MAEQIKIIQCVKSVEEMDDKYLEYLSELILFYWEYKDDNINIMMAEA